MKKNRFKIIYLIYSGLLAFILIFLLLSVNKILKNFEKAQPESVIFSYVDQIQNYIDANDFSSLASLPTDNRESRFSDREQLLSSFVSLCQGKKLNAKLSAKSFDANKPLFQLILDDNPVANLQLNMVSQKMQLGFLSIPTWELFSFCPAAEFFCNSYTLTVPEDFSVTMNELPLTEAEIVSSEDGLLTYLVSGFLTTPDICVKDSFGNLVETKAPTTLIDEGSEQTHIYSVPLDYEVFAFRLPDSFTVNHLDGFVHKKTIDSYDTYYIYTAKPLDIASLSSILSISDSLSQPLSFIETENGILPDYDMMTIILPSDVRLFANGIELMLPKVKSETLTTPQYTDKEPVRNTFLLGLSKKPVFSLEDYDGNQISFTETKNTIEVPLRNIEITIPQNFRLLINGQEPLVTPQLSDHPDYQYVKEYTTLPKLCTYQINGLMSTPTLTIVDNLGNQTERFASEDKIEILHQAGLDALPDDLSPTLDPIALAKKWSLFMTNDLGGSLNGYYDIRESLVPGSYYETVAYRWATEIDITFISLHTFRTPAFSKESIENVVVYNEDCISCDIYFEKHMTLTKTGKLQDDIFHRRIFFLRMDDKNGQKHWVIADMQDITK